MEESPQRIEPLAIKLLKLVLKIGITVLCFWYITTKIDFSAALRELWKADWLWMTIAVMLLVMSKLLSAYRLNIYFNNLQLGLSGMQNIRLYWLGMFYNLFLPGAISGDAYKVILLARRYSLPARKGTAAVLLDRFSGVLGLGMILAIFGMIALPGLRPGIVLAAGAILAIAATNFVIGRFFRDFVTGFWPTLFVGIGVQLLQVVCVYCIMLSIGVAMNEPAWIFIFLASSAISVLPISLGGGLGTREFVFYTGAEYFQLDPHTGVVISLLFYLSGVIASLPGIYYVFRDPLKSKEPPAESNGPH